MKQLKQNADWWLNEFMGHFQHNLNETEQHSDKSKRDNVVPFCTIYTTFVHNLLDAANIYGCISYMLTPQT